MVKNALKKLAGFSVGVAVGALGGATASYLSTPASGDDLRKSAHELFESAMHAGERAQIEREAQLRAKFRLQVDKADALTAPVDSATLDEAGMPGAIPARS